jgi:predicted transcriptional regulator
MLESLDGRRALGGAKAQIKEIRARHQAIMRLHLIGVSQKDIAEVLEISPQMVSIVQNSDIYRAEIGKLQRQATDKVVEETADLHKRIERLAGKSLDVLDDILNDALADNKLKADVAFDILDRGGYKSAQKVEHEITWGDQLKDAYNKRKALKEAEAAVVVDAIALPAPDESTQTDEDDSIVESEDRSTAVVSSVG